jgi:hypothetical protein
MVQRGLAKDHCHLLLLQAPDLPVFSFYFTTHPTRYKRGGTHKRGTPDNRVAGDTSGGGTRQKESSGLLLELPTEGVAVAGHKGGSLRLARPRPPGRQPHKISRSLPRWKRRKRGPPAIGMRMRTLGYWTHSDLIARMDLSVYLSAMWYTRALVLVAPS